MLFGGGKGYTSREAFDWALMRICTTLCSGWFREFATVNYFKIRDRMDNNYIEKFLTLTQNFITKSESERFLEAVQNLRKLKSKELDQLNIEVLDKIQNINRKKVAIF